MCFRKAFPVPKEAAPHDWQAHICSRSGERRLGEPLLEQQKWWGQSTSMGSPETGTHCSLQAQDHRSTRDLGMHEVSKEEGRFPQQTKGKWIQRPWVLRRDCVSLGLPMAHSRTSQLGTLMAAVSKRRMAKRDTSGSIQAAALLAFLKEAQWVKILFTDHFTVFDHLHWNHQLFILLVQ